MKYLNLIILICSLVFLGACEEERPPVSMTEFMDNPRLLEATMVRCGQNRSEMKYVVECVNARDAVNRLATADESAKRRQMEAQSERKRQALRRTQEAAAEARRRAVEAQRMREEEEYLGLFEQIPVGGEPAQQSQPQAIEQPSQGVLPLVETSSPPSAAVTGDAAPAEAGGDAQVESDLTSIRDELRRRRNDPEQ